MTGRTSQVAAKLSWQWHYNDGGGDDDDDDDDGIAAKLAWQLSPHAPPPVVYVPSAS